tara:strand:- start:8193 stop:8618 length:426 start_codon:yes stop_codon:yes gene_type:complete
MQNSGKQDNIKIGFTNGCYDILHYGHLQLINFLKLNCDVVLVAIDSDRRVKENKGPDRPINNQIERAYMLEGIEAVDDVFVFDSDEELRNLVKDLEVDLMVVGSDYKNREVIGSEHAKHTIFFEKIDGYSTTKILQSITSR